MRAGLELKGEHAVCDLQSDRRRRYSKTVDNASKRINHPWLTRPRYVNSKFIVRVDILSILTLKCFLLDVGNEQACLAG